MKRTSSKSTYNPQSSSFQAVDLSSFLSRNIQINDIHSSINKKKKSRRFNTTPSEFCKIDYRIKTFYGNDQQYKFTGSCFKKNYQSQNQNFHNIKYSQQLQSNKKLQIKTKQQNLVKNKSSKLKNKKVNIQEYIQNNSAQLHYKKQTNRQKNTNQQTHPHKIFKITKPAPTRQPQFILKIKKSFLKRHNLEKKKRNASDLIKIQDFLTQKKQQYKRQMALTLISNGQAKLMNQIKQKKGKIYLQGLHLIRKKKKNIQNNYQKMLIKSRQSFSTPNKYISHLKIKQQSNHKTLNLMPEQNSLILS